MGQKTSENRTQRKTVNTRLLVLEMLLAEENEKEYSHRIIADVLNKYDDLDAQDKSFMKRLFEGCVERMIELDYCINHFSKVKTTKMKPVIRNILRMGTYQLLFMDAVPESAACNESVKLAEKKGFHSLKGFTNGVLRTIAREKQHIQYPKADKEPIAALSVTYSVPEWIVSRFLGEYTYEETEKLLQSLLQEHAVTLRIDENLTTERRDQLIEEIRNTGVNLKQHDYLPYAYLAEGIEGVARIPGFAEGLVNVSDVSSMLVAEIAGVRSGDQILDLCAAPGGKTMHLLTKLNGTGRITAQDLTEYKIDRINENLSRSPYQNVDTRAWDATVLDEQMKAQMDIVLVDAPCSGLGVMGKKRDIKYRASEEGIQSLAELQKKILAVAVQYVKEGGTLVYSTCTMTPEENIENVKWLTANCAMECVSIETYLPTALRGQTGEQGYLQLVPGRHAADGFFLAKFIKRGNS